MSTALRRWWPDLVVGVAVLLVGTVETRRATTPVVDNRTPYLWVVVGFALACGLSRRLPGVALVLVWVTCALQLVVGTPVLAFEFTVAIVAFGCSRWGHPLTVILSGLSIPAAGGIGYLVVREHSPGVLRGLALFREIRDNAYRFSDTLLVGATILGLLILAVPWLAGLALRATDRARKSEVQTERAEADVARAQRETEQAQEIARLRDEQARLARDVHDVVGHSLAVILAQAESGQYLPDDDPEKLKATMTTIATSARSSLQDVRQVLTPPGAAPVPPRDGGFEELLAGVRAGGHAVDLTEVGTPRPLPPELEVVAHRVVQEMLTNAIKHGRRDRPVVVERHWPEDGWEPDLRIEVRNVEQAANETQPIQAADGPPGQGLIGMRRRLDSVGGRLDVRRRSDPDGPTFTATAWVPVRSR